MKKSIGRVGGRGKGVLRGGRRTSGAAGVDGHLRTLSSRVEMIQALIPLGLKAVNELLQEDVTRLAGERYSGEGGVPGYAR